LCTSCAAIEHLVKGEVMQMKPSDQNAQLSNLDYYITKSYYKTASLIANSCMAVAVLGGHDRRGQEIAFEYGKNLGIAFQVTISFMQPSSWILTCRPADR